MLSIERLNEGNATLYIEYLKKAIAIEPDMMTAEALDEAGIMDRISDDFYMNTRSLLALIDNNAVGRIEYHFYGCMQDGYRMAYVDWIYVLPDFRHRGIARELFKAFERDCKSNRINQFYLIRAENLNAEKFYKSFDGASLSKEPILRRNL